MLTAARPRAGEPGLTPFSTSLEDEGFFESGRAVAESFARCLMHVFDLWAEQGFDAVAARYRARLHKTRAADEPSLAPTGDLLLANPARRGPPERFSLLPALREPSWLDPATGLPRV